MADEKPRSNNLTAKPDPTVSSAAMTEAPEYPEGTHPIAAVSEQTFSAENKSYAEMSNKPDPTSVAQVEIRPGEKGA